MVKSSGRHSRRAGVPAWAAGAAVTAGGAAMAAPLGTGPAYWVAHSAGGALLAAALLIARGHRRQTVQQADAARHQAEQAHRDAVEAQAREDALGRVAASAAQAVDRARRALAGRSGRTAAVMPGCGDVTGDLRTQLALLEAQITDLPAPADRGGSGGEVEVLLHVGQRLHALIAQAPALMDELQMQTEDPDLLHGLYALDHLHMRLMRSAESLAILGGKTARVFAEPIPVPTALRTAIGSIPHYRRARIAWPAADAAIVGYAANWLVHLLAELIENGTQFSPPETEVMVRSRADEHGLHVLIEDRGLPIPPGRAAELNAMLADPQPVNLGLLLTGQVGLRVVATISHRYGIGVRITSHQEGNTVQVRVPPSLLVPVPQPAPAPAGAPGAAARPPQPPPAPRAGTTAPAPGPAPGPAPALAVVDDSGRPTLPRRSRGARTAPPPAAAAAPGPPDPTLAAGFLTRGRRPTGTPDGTD
ncbi:ATP-binding protein [Streptomyces sp. TRM70308]|uniref:ATP-binding protein n=1 Tax=Streptomyces sp. TRM70308 TaxID=3131932 RepID=UPI003D003509